MQTARKRKKEGVGGHTPGQTINSFACVLVIKLFTLLNTFTLRLTLMVKLMFVFEKKVARPALSL